MPIFAKKLWQKYHTVLPLHAKYTPGDSEGAKQEEEIDFDEQMCLQSSVFI